MQVHPAAQERLIRERQQLPAEQIHVDAGLGGCERVRVYVTLHGCEHELDHVKAIVDDYKDGMTEKLVVQHQASHECA